MLEAKEEERQKRGRVGWVKIREETRILRDVYRSVKSIEGKQQDGKDKEREVGRESNEQKRKEWAEIKEKREASEWKLRQQAAVHHITKM